MGRPITPIPPSFIRRAKFRKRFYGRVVKLSDCWDWSGQKNQAGYGQIEGMIDGHRMVWSAHRIMWTLKRGEIPDGMVVMHKCDNPSCCNPEHLQLGTMRDNTQDAIAKGRMTPRDYLKGWTGPTHPAAKYAAEQRALAVQLRYDHSFNYKQIAEAIGCDRGTVGRWIREAMAARPGVFGQ